MFETEMQKIRTVAEENIALKAKLLAAEERLRLLDELKRVLEAAQDAGAVRIGATPTGSWSPLAMKQQRRMELEAYIINGNRHLTQSNHTLGKRFGMSPTRIADVVGDLVRSGKVPPRPRGRKPRGESESAADPVH